MRAVCSGILVLCLAACVSPPRAPEPPFGASLVVFWPWLRPQDAAAPLPPSLLKRIQEIEGEVFAKEGVLFEDRALSDAGRDAPCLDVPCAADVARALNARWMLTGEVRVFLPQHCFAFFSARSFETGQEILGYDPEEVKTVDVSVDRAHFELLGEKLKRCDDPAFLEGVRVTLKKISESLGE